MNDFTHIPVLLKEALAAMQVRAGGYWVDGTSGGGGHCEAILRATAPEGFLWACDQDGDAVEATRHRLREFEGRFEVRRMNFEGLKNWLGARRVNGVLLDLGTSSHQLDTADRGFSFQADGPLDMRMDKSAPDSAADWLAVVGERELADVIFQLGEERHSRRIARAICDARRRAPIARTGQLAEIVRAALPPAARHGRIHPATRTFQAIRMHVNDELGELRRGLDAARACLRPGGRLCVITFHSLEDRIVKHYLREHFEVVTRKPVVGMPDEIAENPRARSAKLRCGIRQEDAA